MIALRVAFASVFIAVFLVWCWALIRLLASRRGGAPSSGEPWMAGSSIALGVILAAFGVFGVQRTRNHVDAAPVTTCGRIDERTAADAVTERIGRPSRVVSEAESRGPGAEAWLYDDRRCVVHLLDHRVESVEYE
jgi:hypothetical protein